MSRVRLKNIARIEQTRPGRGTTCGWYVQVIWGGHRHTKWFSDGKHGGKKKALAAAVAFRDAVEKKIGRPVSAEPVYSDRVDAGKEPKGGVWIWKGQKDGRPAYWITFRRPDGRLSHTTVSIARYGKTEALAIANERFEAITKSLKSGKDPFQTDRKLPIRGSAKGAKKASAKGTARIAVRKQPAAAPKLAIKKRATAAKPAAKSSARKAGTAARTRPRR